MNLRMGKAADVASFSYHPSRAYQRFNKHDLHVSFC